MKDLHVIGLEEGKSIVFFPKSFRFFIMDDEQVQQFTEIANYKNNPSCNEKPPYAMGASYDTVINILNETVEFEQGKFNKNILPRLVLNISNDCNLRCGYCYASGGSYRGIRQKMSLITLEKTLDMFYGFFDEIEAIQLFGGEPAMNIPAIEFVCEYIRRNSYITDIGMVTNGTIMPECLLELIKQYSIHITVSIDIDTLHDETRPYASGKGSLQTIKDTLDKLKKIGEPGKLEVTYTQLHIDKGYSLYDVVTNLTEQYGIDNIHVAPVSTSYKKYQLSDMESFIKSVDDFVGNGDLSTKPYNLLLTIINTLKSKLVNQYICFAGFGTIAVSAEGKVYPCFYFCENKDFECCSIYDNDDVFGKAVNKMQEKYLGFNRYERPECQECFAINVCRGCLGDNYYETGSEYTTSENTCNMTRGMFEKLLINFAKMKTKKEEE